MTEKTKTEFQEQAPEAKPSDSVTRALWRMQRQLNAMMTVAVVAVPVMFVLGLGVGYLAWGRQGGSEFAQTGAATEQAGPAARVEIEISESDPTRGPEDAPVTIIEFSDFECPYCQRYFQETYSRIFENYGDQVRYVFKDLPLTSIHPNAASAAVAANCANEQEAFWAYHDLLFNMALGLNQEAYLSYAEQLNLEMEAFGTCISDGRYEPIVAEDINILIQAGFRLSTPTFFINGRYIAGAQPYEVFAQLIEEELRLAN